MNKKIYITLLLMLTYQQTTTNDGFVYAIRNIQARITSSIDTLASQLTVANLQTIPAAINSTTNTNIKATLQLGYTLLPYASFIMEKYNTTILQPLVKSYDTVAIIFDFLHSIASTPPQTDTKKSISDIMNSSSVNTMKEYFFQLTKALQSITGKSIPMHYSSVLMYAAHVTTLPSNLNTAVTTLQNSFQNSVHRVKEVIKARQGNTSKVPLVLTLAKKLQIMYQSFYALMNLSFHYRKSLNSSTFSDASAKIMQALKLAGQNLQQPEIEFIADGIYNFNTYLNDTQVQTESALNETIKIFQLFNNFATQTQI